ncbi:MAG: tRNA uridine-5-carboxymethylaminomethyl(34) synthesis GTPase MnmE [Kiritimatiellae bacterium]|nr:tRNA uridine-5-carboxymethylaminomethyl(34) synthesis GTPase MnmE [Kiritimatiellia bacterium]
MYTDDTIAAIATAQGEGSISIVRLSGPQSLTIAEGITRCPIPTLSGRPTHTIVHGFVTDQGRDIDEVLILVMRAPHTFTGEDVVEIQGHGGPVSARRVLSCVLKAGARAAEPGEFTRRAFLNGRIDLVQAEAVLDLVRSSSDRAAEAALQQLEGRLSNELEAIYDDLISAAADLAAVLDFPEEEIHPQVQESAVQVLSRVRTKIQDLLNTWNEGRILRTGAFVVIAGMTNVGKSTLLNTLLNYNRAIVSPIHGTTRDFIEESYCLNGIPVRLVDTAGIRSSSCELEQEGIRRSGEQVAKADLQLYMVDASQPLSDSEASSLRSKTRENCIVVLNKADLGLRIHARDLPGLDVVTTSLVDGTGLDVLRRLMGKKVECCMGGKTESSSHATIAERHRKLLQSAANEVDAAMDKLASGDEEGQFIASEAVRVAAESVAQILGRQYCESLLDGIFSRFCIGK